MLSHFLIRHLMWGFSLSLLFGSLWPFQSEAFSSMFFLLLFHSGKLIFIISLNISSSLLLPLSGISVIPRVITSTSISSFPSPLRFIFDIFYVRLFCLFILPSGNFFPVQSFHGEPIPLANSFCSLFHVYSLLQLVVFLYLIFLLGPFYAFFLFCITLK